MAGSVDRRGFLKTSLAASAGATLAHSFEERALLAHAAEANRAPAGGQPTSKAGAASFPTGRIGNETVSRVICGGNLISGFAHSRDLIYVSSLLQHYFTDDKIFETFHLCESEGINTAMLKLDQKTIRVVQEYWQRQGGTIQWIAQIVKPGSMKDDVRRALDEGAVGIHTTGQMGDELVRRGRVDLLAETVAFTKEKGAAVGVSCHELAVIRACEEAGVSPDFYMKTFNSKNYWSAGPKTKHDNVFNDEPPEETAALFKRMDTPWVAFKVLGAGAISPREGFTYAYENGADFLCVGMFDFQVADDAETARKAIKRTTDRARPWYG